MSAFDKHFTVQEIATRWGFSANMIRRIFRDEPGVLKLGHPETRFKRKRFALRIPESVMLRVHARMATRR
jgi:hypothetical protein